MSANPPPLDYQAVALTREPIRKTSLFAGVASGLLAGPGVSFSGLGLGMLMHSGQGYDALGVWLIATLIGAGLTVAALILGILRARDRSGGGEGLGLDC